MEALNSLEQWDDFIEDRYDPNRKTEDFRNSTTPRRPASASSIA